MLFAFIGAWMIIFACTFLVGYLASIVNQRLPVIYQFKRPYILAFMSVGLLYASVIVLVVIYSSLIDKINTYYIATVVTAFFVLSLFYAYRCVTKWNSLPVRKNLFRVLFVFACMIAYGLIFGFFIVLIDLLIT